MIDWKTKLTSRKLWAAVSEFVGMLLVAFGLAEDTVTQVVALKRASFVSFLLRRKESPRQGRRRHKE